MTKIKLKKCSVCKTEFKQFQSTQIVCSTKCAFVIGKEKEAKKNKAEFKQLKKENRDKDKKWHEAKLVRVCHEYIKYRDRNKPCISCGTTNKIQYAAGHYMPAGNNSSIKFNEYNIHKQCNFNCNCNKSGNLTNYRIALIDKIGLKHVEYLESQKQIYKYSIEELKELAEYYKNKLKYLKSIDNQ